MILDDLNEFCDATACNTGAAGDYLVGDVIDLTSCTVNPTTRDIGTGPNSPYLVITVDTGITTAGAAGTVLFKLVSDSTANLATSPTTHIVTASFATGSTAIAAGTVLACVPLPSGAYEKYLGIIQTTGTTALNAGKINAFLTDTPSKWAALPDAI